MAWRLRRIVRVPQGLTPKRRLDSGDRNRRLPRPMQVLHGTDSVPSSALGGALAIGNFDGVHRGHQALLAVARKAAAKAGGPAGVVLFEPHPREFFQPDRPHFRLTPLPLKLALLDRFGIDFAVVLRFDAALAALSAEEFIARVLVDRLAAAHVVVGYDFRFGKGRGGDPETLRRAGAAHGFGVTIVPQVAEGGEVFSSGAIRAELGQGDVKGAGEMLGWWWRVSGKVIGGAKRGTGLGYPTANIALAPGTALAHGIYAVRVEIGGRRLDGAAYLGTRPTFDDGAPVLEVFLFDFDDDIYGREIAVELIDFIRPDRRFDGPDALKTQMDADCARARDILAAAPALPGPPTIDR
jgi:riboflavin kinase/FMN adenylyltransferase